MSTVPAIGEGQAAAAEQAERDRPWRRRLRRTGIGVLAAILAVTVASLVFNLVTEPPARLDPQSGSYVQVGDSDVHYQQWGDQGSPIVLVPGAMESSVAWSTVGPLLGEHHRVYAIDMPWLGYTRYTGQMDLNGQVLLLDGFMNALHLDRPLVVGHSLGAGIVAGDALAHPASLGGVVFADGDGLPFGFGPQWLGKTLVRLPYVTSAMRIAERSPQVVRSVIASNCGTVCPAATLQLAREWIRPLGQQAEKDALTYNAGYGLTDAQIASITVPATIVWGSEDHATVSLPATEKNLPHAPVHIIPNAGHLSMIANPTAFAAAIEAAQTQP